MSVKEDNRHAGELATDACQT